MMDKKEVIELDLTNMTLTEAEEAIDHLFYRKYGKPMRSKVEK